MFQGWLRRALVYRVEVVAAPHPKEGIALMKPPVGVMHTTEGSFQSALDEFKVKFAPHFLVGSGRIIQLVPLGHMAAALEHRPGTVETNRWARAQIEIAASSKLAPWQPDSHTFDALAALVLVLERKAGIPLSRPYPDTLAGGVTWATDSNPRRKHSHWGSQPGWFGHVEVPGNSHWDPGSLHYRGLFERARDLGRFYKHLL